VRWSCSVRLFGVLVRGGDWPPINPSFVHHFFFSLSSFRTSQRTRPLIPAPKTKYRSVPNPTQPTPTQPTPLPGIPTCGSTNHTPSRRSSIVNLHHFNRQHDGVLFSL